MKVIRILTAPQAKFFATKFQFLTGYAIPPETFLDNQTIAIEGNDGLLHGGICFIEDRKNFRVLRQIPVTSRIKWPSEYDICELTAFWTDKDSSYLRFLANIAWRVVFHRKKYFVYSYAADCRKLQEYYARGKPIRLYSGLMATGAIETVECLTKLGVVKIFLGNIWDTIRLKR